MRKSTLIAQAVWHLLRDLRKFELAALLTLSAGNSTFIWDSKNVTPTSGASLPWSVNYPLSHHRKHIFRLTPPTLKPIIGKLSQWKNRLLWRTYYENAAAYDAAYGTPYSEPVVDMVPFRSRLLTPGCPHGLPEIRHDIDRAVEQVTHAAVEALEAYKSRHKNVSNISNTIKFAAKTMETNGFCVNPDG